MRWSALFGTLRLPRALDGAVSSGFISPLRGRVSAGSVLEEAPNVGVSDDVEVPRTDPDVEVVASGVDEDVSSSVVVGTQ
jgi:hypothetical protein